MALRGARFHLVNMGTLDTCELRDTWNYFQCAVGRWAARGRYRSVFGEVWNSLRYFGGLLPPDFLRLVGTWRIRGVVRQISLSAPVFCQSENLHFGRYLGVVIVTSVAIAAPFFCQSIFVAFINRFSRDSVWFS